MTDKPILFSGQMVRALLEGQKTQTRRALKPQPDTKNGGTIWSGAPFGPLAYNGTWPDGTRSIQSPPYAIGDRLWVREAWKTDRAYDDLAPSEMGGEEPLIFDADKTVERWGWKPDSLSRWGRFRQGMHMPRWASRLTLTVTDVRVQRVQEISADDAIAEGINHADGRQYLNCYGPSGCPTDEDRSCNKHGCWGVREDFRDLWDSLNASRGFGWQENPWVAAYTFTVETRNIDE